MFRSASTGARYYVDGAPLVFSGNPYEGIWGTRVRCASGITSRCRARRRFRRTARTRRRRVRSDALCLQIILKALGELGSRAEDVVRTRVYGTRADIFDDVARAHHEVFGQISPASAFVVIKELADRRWLVEVEADAIVAA
jgi:phenylpyruvate tautomerase PptA (4-oxalocrotonate tautomerase family)